MQPMLIRAQMLVQVSEPGSAKLGIASWGRRWKLRIIANPFPIENIAEVALTLPVVRSALRDGGQAEFQIFLSLAKSRGFLKRAYKNRKEVERAGFLRLASLSAIGKPTSSASLKLVSMSSGSDVRHQEFEKDKPSQDLIAARRLPWMPLKIEQPVCHSGSHPA